MTTNPMWWLADPHDLTRVSDRVSFVYVERNHIDRDENAVVFINKERTVRVPAALVAVLLVGPGCRITSAAVRLLADSGTSVSWVGEHGVRLYASGAGTSRSAGLAQRQAVLVSNTRSRLAVARRMYTMRFNEDVGDATMQQLRGREGTRMKRLYRSHAERTGVEWNRRSYSHGETIGSDPINLVLSAANACLYGIVHAAVTSVGAVPALGFVHTGSSQSFVLDIADLYKAELILPLAFNLTAEGFIDEPDVRRAVRDMAKEHELLRRIVGDITALLGHDPAQDAETSALWDERVGEVAGGTNYGEVPSYRVITGPEIPEFEVPW